jgi:hypothetical protein
VKRLMENYLLTPVLILFKTSIRTVLLGIYISVFPPGGLSEPEQRLRFGSHWLLAISWLCLKRVAQENQCKKPFLWAILLYLWWWTYLVKIQLSH